MKRTSIYYLSLAAILAGSLVSCQDENQGFDEYVIREAAILREYQNNFEARYGKSDVNHDWGFGDDQPVLRSYANAMTRGFGAAGVNVNVNQWTTQSDGNLTNDLQVPGWPNFDGYYYTTNGIKSAEQLNLSADQARGDVTDYEIQYVSTWFRTHKDPVSETLHLTDFFVQNISADADQVTYNNYVVGNGKSGQITGNNGDNANYSQDVLVPGTADTKKTVTVNGESVQAVPNVTILADNKTSNYQIQYDLDHLNFKPYGASDFVASDALQDQTGWTHVNNYNSGNSNHDPEAGADHRTNREIKYITSSGTEDFACRASQATKNPWNNKWVLVHLTWEEVGHDGKTYTREGYYLGFDFKLEKNEIKVDYDGFYSNWIIKISPTNFAPTSSAKRVMCEDLGSTFDFDFDDVVFDVAYPSDNEALITLQAAGGTLPIYVGNHTADFEAHYLLGNEKGDYTTPVNVGIGNSHAPAVYRISCTSATKNAKYIPIYVEQGDKTYVLTGQVPDASDEQYLTTVDANGNAISVNGNTYIISENNDPRYNRNGNSAPRRFAVPVDVKWMKETQFIEHGYKNFPKWVQDKDWSSNSQKWYEIVSDPSLLYNTSVVVKK